MTPHDIREPLRVVIDTREQSPWAWPLSDVVCRFAGLAAGDYALESDTEPVRGRDTLAVRFAIERKSLSDWAGTISTGWDRFQRELDRMTAFPARIILIEGTFEQCCFLDDLTPPQHGHPMIPPAFVCRRIAELSMRNVTVLFCGRADYAAAQAYRLFLIRKEMQEDNTKGKT